MGISSITKSFDIVELFLPKIILWLHACLVDEHLVLGDGDHVGVQGDEDGHGLYGDTPQYTHHLALTLFRLFIFVQLHGEADSINYFIV